MKKARIQEQKVKKARIQKQKTTQGPPTNIYQKAEHEPEGTITCRHRDTNSMEVKKELHRQKG